MGSDIFVSLSGNADRLSQVRASLLGNWDGWNWASLGSVALSRFFLALVITYLLMAALFENFLHPAGHHVHRADGHRRWLLSVSGSCIVTIQLSNSTC